MTKNEAIALPAKNNLDMIRLLFAANVFLFHTYILSGIPSFKVLHYDHNIMALKGFFMISGFLVYMSYQRSTSFWGYLEKRIRRIYPVYFTAIVLFAIALFPFSTKTVLAYFTSFELYKYFAANLSFLNFIQPCLPGVFVDNVMCSVNGALWILKIEVAFYLLVPVIAWIMKRYNKLAVFIVIYLASSAYFYYFEYVRNNSELAKQLPGQLSYFISGVMVNYYYNTLIKYKNVLVPIAIIAFGASYVVDIWYTIPLSISILIVYFAFVVPQIVNTGKFGDISYGVYIFHFPIIQVFRQLGFYDYNRYLAMGTSIVLTFIIAVGSWHLVEKRFLKRSSHYVKAKSV